MDSPRDPLTPEDLQAMRESVRAWRDECDGDRALASAANRLAGHVDDLLDEVERLRAALAEAEATLLNERGEGEPPGEGWAWSAELRIWEWTSPGDYAPTWDVRVSTPGKWHWRCALYPYTRSRVPVPTARAAMKAADTARTATDKEPT